jgi:5-methyltetrahydropteroyltriglutamate--homocysteine methyltransferase
MKRSRNCILATHVGSLIRPQSLQEFLRSKQAGKPYDENAYQKCLTASVADVVRDQVQAGIDVVNDGEFGKSISWAQYALERLSGFERRPIKQDTANPFKRGADRTKFAEFYAELDAKEGVATTTEAICVGPIKYTGQAELQRDIDNFKAALKGVTVEEAFLPVAAPASVIPDRKNEYYKSDGELQAAIAEAMRSEYKMIVDSGFLLQLDDARSAVTFDRMVPPASFADYRNWLANQVDILNHAIEGLPADRIRYHVCWGSWPGPHTSDVPLKDIVDPPEGEGRGIRDRGCQPAPRTRVAGLEEREAFTRAGPYSGRYQPRDQCDRASRTGRRTHRAARQDCRARERYRRHGLRLCAGTLLSSRSSHGHVGKT